MSESLDDLRRAIDAIDADLVNLLAQRAQQVKLIGERKAEVDAPAFVPDRESTILERVTRLNPGPFEAAHVRSIFREIISAGRNLEEPERVEYSYPQVRSASARRTVSFVPQLRNTRSMRPSARCVPRCAMPSSRRSAPRTSR